MKYQFPRITNISQVLPIIKDKPEFIVAVKDAGYSVVNYVVMAADTFPLVTDEDSAILRELRGIKFDTDTGEVICRPFHKFFNVSERPETLISELDLSQPHVILEKLDGSMIVPFKVGNELHWGTKMGVTDVAIPVLRFVADHPDYIEFAENSIAQGCSPIFEWCSRQQRIVIDYPTDMLVLTASRHIVSGEYLSYSDTLEWAEQFDIPVVRAFSGTAANMQSLVDQTGPMVGLEGFVVCFEDGHRIKVKAEDYLRKHKAKDSVSREKNVVELIVTGQLDDVKSFLDEGDLARILAFEKQFWIGIHETVHQLMTLRAFAAEQKLDIDRRTYAVEFVQKMHNKYSRFLYQMMDEHQNLFEMVTKTIAASCGTQTRLDECRWMFGNVSWLSQQDVNNE